MIVSEAPDFESRYWTMRQSGQYWLTDADGKPIHIDLWREREKLRAEYNRQFDNVFGKQ